MTNLTEELKQRLDSRPDQWTLAWWNEQFQEVLKGYRGANHGINRALADYEEAYKEIKELRELVQSLARHREDDRAKLGELQETVEKMREWAKKQGKNSER
jgi:hypothetical protein